MYLLNTIVIAWISIFHITFIIKIRREEIINEHSKLYSHLNKQLKWFKRTGTLPDSDCVIYTTKVSFSNKEAINFLQNQQTISELIHNKKIVKTGQDYVNNIDNNRTINHIVSSWQTNTDHLNKYIEWNITITEKVVSAIN